MATNPSTAFDVAPTRNKERRARFRTKTIHRLVKLRCSDSQAFAKVKNISDGGMCLSSPYAASIGDRLTIFFTNDFWLEGEVVWTAPPEMGLRFKSAVDCRVLLAEATHSARCLKDDPLSLEVLSPMTLSCGDAEVSANLRSISPLQVRVEAADGFKPGLRIRIRLASGAERHGVVHRADKSIASILLCDPLSFDEVGCHAISRYT